MGLHRYEPRGIGFTWEYLWTGEKVRLDPELLMTTAKTHMPGGISGLLWSRDHLNDRASA
jgi:hypothetical protein